MAREHHRKVGFAKATEVRLGSTGWQPALTWFKLPEVFIEVKEVEEWRTTDQV